MKYNAYFNYHIVSIIVETFEKSKHQLLYVLVVETCHLRCQSFHEEVNEKFDENTLTLS